MKKCIVAALLLTVSLSLSALPARRSSLRVTLADGTKVSAVLSGDEFAHSLHTTDGRLLVGNEDGTYRYATVADEMLESEMIQRGNERRNAANQQRINRLNIWHEKDAFIGSRRGLVILVQFSDTPMMCDEPQKAFDDQFNGVNYKKNGHIGSVRDYFKRQSYGQFDLQFDVVGPVTVSKELKYYGKNKGVSDMYPEEMVAEAVVLADSLVDYSNYDWDGDGYVDQVYLIYAGFSEADGAPSYTIWPHSYFLEPSGNGPIQLDGVLINQYACSSELTGINGFEGTMIDFIGSACHEFSHCLGLPDFYSTNSVADVFGMNRWSIMDYGVYNGEEQYSGSVPAGYTSYERWCAGWLEPTELSQPCIIDEMSPLEDVGEAYVIYNDANKDEFYLLENRQLKGYDKYLHGHGMLIIHVDFDESEWNKNTVNYYPNHPRCTVIPADNRIVGSFGDVEYDDLAGDPWPGTSDNHELTDYSVPAATLYNENVDGTFFMGKPIEDIVEIDDFIGFTFMGGDPSILSAPVAFEPKQVNGHSFEASWKHVTCAESYVLEVTEVDNDSTTNAAPARRTVSLPLTVEDITETTYLVTDLDTLHTYSYRVKAVNAITQSEWSNAVTCFTVGDFVPTVGWTEWKPFENGTCTYKNTLLFDYEDEGLSIMYRDSYEDHDLTQIRIDDWCYNSLVFTDEMDTLVIEWNRSTNICSVPEAFTGFEDPDYGKVYCSDETYYYTNVLKMGGKNMNYDQCTYNPKTGKFTLSLVYYDYDSPMDPWGKGVEYVYVDGNNFKNFDISIQLGDITDTDDYMGHRDFTLNPALDVAYMRYAFVPKEYLMKDIDDLVLDVQEGIIPSTMATGVVSGTLDFASGRYTLVALTYDVDSTYQAMAYTTFSYSSPFQWHSIGACPYTDDIFAPSFTSQTVTYNVEVQENDLCPGLFRMVNPYGEAHPLTTDDDILPGDYYIEIDATDPDHVFIDYQSMGVMNGDTECYIYSMVSYFIDEGYEREDFEALGAYGTFRNGVITFPKKMILLVLGTSMDYSNLNGGFRLDVGASSVKPQPDPQATDVPAECYDLAGRRQSGKQLLAPGLYIRDGKKVIIR